MPNQTPSHTLHCSCGMPFPVGWSGDLAMPTPMAPHTALQVYVPLAGVQTELLRATFEPNEVEVKCVNLQVGPLNIARHLRAHMLPAALPFHSLIGTPMNTSPS